MHYLLMGRISKSLTLVGVLVSWPVDAGAQVTPGEIAAYAAGIRELATPGHRTFPGLTHAIVNASDGERHEVDALADSLAVVAVDLAGALRGTDDQTRAEIQWTYFAVVQVLEVVGTWPDEAGRGDRYDGAGERLLRIAHELPEMELRDEMRLRSRPLQILLRFPDSFEWRAEVVELARGEYPAAVAATIALWLSGEEGQETVLALYRSGELSDRRARAWVEFQRSGLGSTVADSVRKARWSGMVARTVGGRLASQ